VHSRHCGRARQRSSRWCHTSQWLLFPRIFYKEENDLKIFRNRTVIGVLCILLALIICFGVTPLFSRSASEKTDIVRVTKDIKEGDEITAEMVQTVEVGAYNLPQNLMTDKKEVVGKYATADLVAGDYILSSKLSAVPAAENAYLYNLDGTKQAISVTIKSFATGLSGKLESGDIVTVIVADYQGKGETAIPPELQYVEVISVTASSGYDANTGEVVDEKELPSTVTLLVTTEQAKVLAELEQDSELHLALVYRGTPENADKFIAAQDALIEELYAEPEPENSGETAEGTESKESEGAEPSAESEATE
jgi:pilus assembly protein CpaB